MEDKVKHLCERIRQVSLETSKKLAFKPPTDLSVFVIKNLVIINVEGIFNKAEIIASENRQNREKIILARHAVASIWLNSVANSSVAVLGTKPLTYYLDYRPEFNTAMFVMYYDKTFTDD